MPKVNSITIELSFPEQKHHCIVKFNTATGKTNVTGDLFPREQELISKIVNGLQRDARDANRTLRRVVRNTANDTGSDVGTES